MLKMNLLVLLVLISSAHAQTAANLPALKKQDAALRDTVVVQWSKLTDKERLSVFKVFAHSGLLSSKLVSDASFTYVDTYNDPGTDRFTDIAGYNAILRLKTRGDEVTHSFKVYVMISGRSFTLSFTEVSDTGFGIQSFMTASAKELYESANQFELELINKYKVDLTNSEGKTRLLIDQSMRKYGASLMPLIENLQILSRLEYKIEDLENPPAPTPKIPAPVEPDFGNYRPHSKKPAATN